MDELELYPKLHPIRSLRAGVRTLRTEWKTIVAYTVVVVLVAGVAGYRWVTRATPMDRTSAVELFRAENQSPTPTRSGERRASRPLQKRSRDERPARGARPEGAARRGAAPAAAVASRAPARRDSSRRSAAPSRQARFVAPKEGVYSWATDGHEQVSGARREFPRESQRIITLDGKREWTQHHYFSEEREIWTHFLWSRRGAEIGRQRNRVVFGPVTNESTIDFRPPMLVGPKDLEVGRRWTGRWDGATYGDYRSEIFAHTTMSIGGEPVEVWGMAYEINLRGDQEGRVTAEVWLAPAYGVTVQEHYKQDIRSSGAHYQAEWTQKLKSLEPRR